jgi:hypothetical protein
MWYTKYPIQGLQKEFVHLKSTKSRGSLPWQPAEADWPPLGARALRGWAMMSWHFLMALTADHGPHALLILK